jgi:predicted Fe-Mo cluster-binding NifX family protein
MKIAAPVNQNGGLEDHFGQCAFYKIYTISEEGQISSVKTIASEQGCGCKSGIARKLASDGVEIMVAGGIGGGAIATLNNSGIQVVRGCSGMADEIVKLYIAGKIKDSGESCLHHEHHHGQGHSGN